MKGFRKVFLNDFPSFNVVPGVPLNVQLVVYGRSAHISWNPPLNPNGYIEQYEISWSLSRDSDRQQAKPAARTTIKKDRRSREAYMISDFEPFTYYDVRMSARNRVGPGEDFERILFSVGAPDGMYLNLFYLLNSLKYTIDVCSVQYSTW